MNELRNNKTPRSDGIPAELIKYEGEHPISFIHRLLKSIWLQEKIPKGWKVSVICPLHKKGDTLCCGTYRGITLLNVGYKILSNIISSKIRPYHGTVIDKYQCGFMKVYN